MIEAITQELNISLARIKQLEDLYATAGEAMKKTGRSVEWNEAAECFSIVNEKNEISCQSLEHALRSIVKLGE